MYRRKHRDQLSFKDFFLPFGGQLSGENRWIRLAELIPWDELDDDYASQFVPGENHERAVLKTHLGVLNREGVLIRADALHTQQPFFNSSRSRGPTFS